MDRELLENGLGCVDPTAYRAIKNVDENSMYRFHKLLNVLHDVCELSKEPLIDKSGVYRFHKVLDALHDVCGLAGFSIEEHIILKDKVTGKIWR